jgi:hypothetical protein
MIISKKNKFLFIKPHKTAGTSLEIALSKYCGDEDIITPMGGNDEKLRREISGRGSQNYTKPIKALGAIGSLRAMKNGKRPRLWNHASYNNALNFCNFPEFPDCYYVFAFERNPFEKVSSSFFQMKARRNDLIFSNFCNPSQLRLISDFDLYTDQAGELAATVFRYEELSDSLHEIASKTRLPSLELPRAKGGFRRGLRIEFSSSEIRMIQDIFEREFKTFHYSTFPNNS